MSLFIKQYEVYIYIYMLSWPLVQLVSSEHTDPLKLCREIHQHCPHSCLSLTFHFELLTWLIRATLSFHGIKAGDSLGKNSPES